MENIFVEFLPPWVETGLQPAFYDKESGTVLQQTARMYARVNMLIRMFNKLSKQTKETVDHYIEEFTTLYNYVHDYFDNLDVQEEINNKLDEMTEDGTLQEIITAYIQSSALWCFDSVQDMQEATNLINGSFAMTLGYYSANDGGESIYKISDTSSNSDYCIPLSNDLYAILVITDRVNIRQLGAMGGDSYYPTASEINLESKFNNLAEAQVYYPSASSLNENIDGCAIERAIELYYDRTIIIPKGIFYINKTITPTHSYLNIYGTSRKYCTIVYTDTPDTMTPMFLFNNTSQHNTIKDLEICGPYEFPETIEETADYLVQGICCQSSSYNTFINLEIRKVYDCIDLQSCFCSHLNDCFLHKAYYGLHCSAGNVFHNTLVEFTKVQYTHIGMYMRGGRSQAINNCDFENDDIGLRKTNQGTISVFQCYFEDQIEIRIGDYSSDNVTIDSCSFHLLTQTQRLPFIRFHGDARNTKITISNNLFVNEGSTTLSGPCIVQQYDDTLVSPMTCVPILINNAHKKITNLVDYNNFYGTLMTSQHDNNLGKVNVAYFNTGDGGTLVLDEYKYTYRLHGGTQGVNANIQIPYITNVERSNREYTFLIPTTVGAGTTNTITFTAEDPSKMDIQNAGPHNLVDLRGHVVKVRYFDEYDSKRHWQVFIM